LIIFASSSRLILVRLGTRHSRRAFALKLLAAFWLTAGPKLTKTFPLLDFASRG
jgi:hypothetical protein